MIHKQADGHFLAYFSERIELLDGNVIRAGGLVDDFRLTEGEPATFPATVIDGPLAGAIGYRQFKPAVQDSHTVYQSSVVYLP